MEFGHSECNRARNQRENPVYPSLVKLNVKILRIWTARPEQTVTAVMADNSYLTYSFWVYIHSLTTVSESRLFGSVIEHWTFNPAARVQIPPKSWDLKIVVLKVRDIISHNSAK